mgnify:CR=1 FL=1|jgi:hypothetical protein
MDIEFSTYYKSLTTTHRVDEEFIVTKAVEKGVVPVEVRYGIMNGAYRGVVKSSNEILYYFSYVQANDAFSLIKASDPSQIYEAGRMLEKCMLGCDLIKAEPSDSASGGINTIEEEHDIADQDDLRTDKHPAAAGITTPDNPSQGRMWHEQEMPAMTKSWDASSLLDSLNDNLRKSTEGLLPPVSNMEQRFIVEVLGRTPDQVRRGDIYMNPTQKVMYQQWLGKSMMSKVSGLSKWLKK